MGKKRLSSVSVRMAAACLAVFLPLSARVSAKDGATEELLREYEAYREGFVSIETVGDIEGSGFEVVQDQSFPVLLETFGEQEVYFIPAMHREYHRLAVMIADGAGEILYKTDQLETNYKYTGMLEQPTKDIAAVSFQDVDGDGLTDIILITDCQNEKGEYAGVVYKTGDVLFQGEGGFYRDWRISDKINRFNMNRSADFITAYVRDGNSTEALYTAATLDELVENGFQIIEEQHYTRSFEKLGRLEVVPGTMRMAEYDVFMIYLVNDQGYIVWSFQPMEDYDNLYALKGMTCRDMDGDGMKDILVLARYSYSDSQGKMQVDVKCSIYYQRTGGFAEDGEFSDTYQCTEEDTVGGLVDTIREYWGWPKEE